MFKTIKNTVVITGLVVLLSLGINSYLNPKEMKAEAYSPSNNGTSKQEANKTEKQQEIHNKNTPIKELQNSTERKNLIKRMDVINDDNKVMYIYLLSDTGLVIMQDTLKGKVSSLNSYLTTPEQIICRYESSTNCHVVSSPDLDGSYGKNPEGVFWFSATGAYREWTGKYIVSDQEFSINTPVTLTKIK